MRELKVTIVVILILLFGFFVALEILDMNDMPGDIPESLTVQTVELIPDQISIMATKHHSSMTLVGYDTSGDMRVFSKQGLRERQLTILDAVISAEIKDIDTDTIKLVFDKVIADWAWVQVEFNDGRIIILK